MKTLFWLPSTGFGGVGDRLRALAPMIMRMRETGHEHLCIKWPKTDWCPAEFGDLFDLPFISVVKGSAEHHDSPVVSLPANAWWKDFHRAMPAAFPTYRDFGQKVTDGLRLIFAGMRNPLPSRADKHPSLGIHLRRTDNIVPSKRIPDRTAASLRDKLLMDAVEAEKPSRVFLASDSGSHAQAWDEMLTSRGIEVMRYPHQYNCQELRQTSVHSALQDIVGLSRCRTILASCPSSMLMVASRLNCRPQIRLIEPA